MTTLRLLHDRTGHTAILQDPIRRWVAVGDSPAVATLAVWDDRTAHHTALAATGGLKAEVARLNARLGDENARFVDAGTHIAFVHTTPTGRTMVLNINAPLVDAK